MCRQRGCDRSWAVPPAQLLHSGWSRSRAPPGAPRTSARGAGPSPKPARAAGTPRSHVFLLGPELGLPVASWGWLRARWGCGHQGCSLGARVLLACCLGCLLLGAATSQALHPRSAERAWPKYSCPRPWAVRDGAVTLACLVCLWLRQYLKQRGPPGGGGLMGGSVAAESGATTRAERSGEKLGS